MRPKQKTPLARVNSSHRIHSKDNIPPLKRGPSAQRVNTISAYTSANTHPNTNTTSKGKGFTLAASKDDQEEDEDEWESSESGAATPLQNHDSDSEETASEADAPLHHINNARLGPSQQQQQRPGPRQMTATTAALPRIETARPNEFHAPPRISVGHDSAPHTAGPLSTKTPTLPPSQAPPFLQQMSSTAASDNHTTSSSNDVTQLQSQLRRMELDSTKETRTDPPQHPHPQRSSHSRQHSSHSQQPPSQSQHSHSTHASPRHSQAGTNGSSGRRSRPPSTYSQSGSGPNPAKDLRPHPLIRGLSTGAVNPGRGGTLAPLTVQTGTAPPQLSTSPASSINHDHTMTISPTSTTGSVPASWNEGPAAYLQDRRASVSSARSIHTLPGLYPSKEAPSFFERARTISLLTGSGSSAALSALSHLPVSVTRPPSPQPQHQVYFFPPVNPHANVEAIHPLLPAAPYLGNHLTVLARRNPLRESWERVVRARRECAAGVKSQ